MLALMKNKPAFVELYLDHGACVANLKPTKETSYTKGSRSYASSASTLCARNEAGDADISLDFPRAVGELYTSASKSANSYVKDLYKGKAACTVDHMERLMGGLVGGGFNITRDWKKFNQENKKESIAVAYHVLMVSGSSDGKNKCT